MRITKSLTTKEERAWELAGYLGRMAHLGQRITSEKQLMARFGKSGATIREWARLLNSVEGNGIFILRRAVKGHKGSVDYIWQPTTDEFNTFFHMLDTMREGMDRSFDIYARKARTMHPADEGIRGFAERARQHASVGVQAAIKVVS